MCESKVRGECRDRRALVGSFKMHKEQERLGRPTGKLLYRKAKDRGQSEAELRTPRLAGLRPRDPIRCACVRARDRAVSIRLHQ